MHDRKIKYFVLGLIAFTLVLTGVYAILTTTLNISGTATGATNFKIQFDNVSVTDTNKATTALDTDQTTLNINTSLSYPGDSVTINFSMKNTGSLNASIDNITINNPNSDDFTVQINGLDTIEGTVLSVGNQITSSIVITWKSTSTNQTPDTVPFSISIDYSQST